MTVTLPTRRWLVIAICLAVPTLIVVWSARSVPPIATRVDVRRPPSCVALYWQASYGDRAAALKDARTAVVNATATVEERSCAVEALAQIQAAPPGTPVKADLSKARCTFGAALIASQAPSAAAHVAAVMSVDGPDADRTCATSLAAAGAVADPALPQCNRVARAYASESLSDATTIAAAALVDATTTAPDVACLLEVGTALRSLPEGGTASKVVVPELPDQPCEHAAALAESGEVGRARDEYEAILHPPPSPGTTVATAAAPDLAVPAGASTSGSTSPRGTLALGASVPSRLEACALGGLSRLPAGPGLADTTFARTQWLVRTVTGPLPGGPLSVNDGAKATVVASVWLVTLVLLVVALRQFVRWRRERLAGPVTINPIDTPADDTSATALAEVMRDRLAETGLYPTPKFSQVGEIVLDVTEVASAAGDKGWLGKAFEAIKTALQIKSGYAVTAKAHHDDHVKDEPCRLTVQLDRTSTGETVFVRTFGGATYHQAANRAVYEVYLTLADNREVRRRTPIFLQWTSAPALQNYHEAIECRDAGHRLDAVKLLQQAEKEEPGHLLLHLTLARVYLDLALGTPGDNALRCSWPERQKWFLQSTLAATRAVTIDPRSSEAHNLLAIVLSYAEQWREAWQPAQSPSREIQSLLTRLHSAVEVPGAYPLAPLWPQTLNDRRFLAMSLQHWVRARRLLAYPNVLRTGWHLQTRRSVTGYLWPLRRRRASIRDMARGGELATSYNSMVVGNFLVWPVSTRARLAILRNSGLMAVRHLPELEGSVRYNLACAHARRAVWHYASNRRDAAERAETAAMKHLRSLATSQSSTFSDLDLDAIAADPDFDTLRTQRIYEDFIREFRAYDPPQETRDAWVAQLTDVADQAMIATELWQDRQATPGPQSGWTVWTPAVVTWNHDVLAWLVAERVRWAALQTWGGAAARTSARDAFVAAFPLPEFTPHVARPAAVVVSTADDKLGVSPALRNNQKIADAIADRLASRWVNLGDAGGHGVAACDGALAALQTHIENRDSAAVRDTLAAVAPAFRAYWLAVRSFALNPDATVAADDLALASANLEAAVVAQEK